MSTTSTWAKVKEIVRSTRWRSLRRSWLKEHPTCAACGTNLDLEVHHKTPVHVDPARELDRTNLITLCEQPGINHHLWVGHLGNWHDFNIHVEADAARELARRK